MKPFYVYMLRCADGSYYSGQTDDLSARLVQHEDGQIGYTSTRKPVELVWQGEFETREGAIAFEQQIKGWSRAKKEALMAGDWDRVQKLARSRQGLDGGGGLRQAQPEREGELRQAQPEREGELRLTQPEQGGAGSAASVRPELVEGLSQGLGPALQEGLRQAQPERVLGLRQDQPERVGELRQAQPEQGGAGSAASVRPELVEGLLRGSPPIQRRAIAKAITLLESTRADHRAQGDELLTAILPHTGKSFRLGVSGVPGVGKSTFIEALGLYLIGQGHRVAVLTIDPSSTISGGSILGDKTRMEHLSVHEKAYIRPSPSSGTLGGVAEKTREAMLVCEAAGYDVVIVETVGVGQSETAVAGMTDMFVLMQLPNAGDDLQAIKKGVMELADLVVINKADIDAHAATRAEAQITSALRLFGMHGNPDHAHHDEALWHPQVVKISALLAQGVDHFWTAVRRFRELQTANGRLTQRRQQQALAWMWERVEAGLKQAFRQNPTVSQMLPEISAQVAQGRLPASTAARHLLAAHAHRYRADFS